MRFPALATLLLSLLLTCTAGAQTRGLVSRPAFQAFNAGALPPNASTISGKWAAVPAFPQLTFQNPMGIVQKPGTNLMLVWEREGRVWSFVKDAVTVSKTLLLDIHTQCQGWDDSGLMNLVFHPDFANNGYVFLYYTWVPTGTVQGNATTRPPLNKTCYDRLSRFTMLGDGTIDPASEQVLIHQRSATVWHNGGGMFFHPDDGFLYLVNGDDYVTANAQRINTGLHSGVLRIDVDQRGGAISRPITRQPLPVGSFTANYFIPNDNPFVGQSGVLEEFFAIGLRSPHRMTLDAVSGRIFISDVGHELREEINVIDPGDVAANFQWPKFEGLVGDMTAPYLGLNKQPVIDYTHSDGQAVIGGVVYRGHELPELQGKYLFGDNMVGTIWYLDESTTPASKVAICKLPNGPGPNSGESYVGLSSFGVDAEGELYLTQLSSTGGRVYKLQRSGTEQHTMPATLTGTGVFGDLPSLQISTGFQSYDVNSPFWSDGAVKQRWFAIPDGQKIGYVPTGEWSFPQGSVFVKHFELDTDETQPGAMRRLETRILVRDDQGFVYGGSYRWRPDQSDADLVGTAQSEDITITTTGGGRVQRWHFPSRQECLACHTQASKGVLGVNARQTHLSRLFPETGLTDDQLLAWNHVGYFAPSLDELSIAAVPRLAGLNDATVTVEQRVRSYLDSNCAHCHRPGGGARGSWDGRFETPLANAGIVEGSAFSDLGIAGARIVEPQDVLKSLLHRRMNTAMESYAMPPIGKSRVDTEAVSLLSQWINGLPPTPEEEITAPWVLTRYGEDLDGGGPVIKRGGRYTLGQMYGQLQPGSPMALEQPSVFLGQAIAGNASLMARVSDPHAFHGNVSTTSDVINFGLVIRESLADGARRWTVGSDVTVPVQWLMIQRNGKTISTSRSADGVVWSSPESLAATLPSKLFMGMWVGINDGHNSLGTRGDATFDNVHYMPVVPWVLTQQPRSQLVRSGELVEFGIETLGFTPTSYRWRKNSTSIVRAVAARYAFKAALASAGSYSVLTGGKLASSAANLVVLDKVIYTNNRAPGATATFSLSYAGTGAGFRWTKDGAPLQNGSKFSGATSARLTVKSLTLADIGNYECIVTDYGRTIVLGPYPLHVLSKPVITAPSPLAWSVSRAFSWQLAADEPVAAYKVTGLPSGLTYNAKTGLVLGIPNVGSSTSYSITVTATNGAGTGPAITYNLVIEPFPESLAGKFTGLIDQHTANGHLGGALALTVNSNGTVTGTLAFGARSHSLNARTVFVSGNDPMLNFVLSPKGSETLTLALTLDRQLGTISGTVNGVAVALRKVVTSVVAGSYNAELKLPAGLDGNLTVPQGTGWARWVIGKTGAVAVTGRLSDGTVLTSSHALRVDSRVAWRQVLYSGRGVVQGTPQLGGGSVTGTLGWRKTAAASTADYTYPADFGQVNLGVNGVVFSLPPAGVTFLGNPDADGNATIALTHGGISEAAPSNLPDQVFRLRATHTASFSSGGLINPNRVAMSIMPGTGVFSGSLTLKDGTLQRTVRYYGVFLPGRSEALGAFTLRQLPGAKTSPILSGQVRLSPLSAP